MCEFKEPNESQLSPSELYDKGQQDMDAAQKEAEDWADENGMDTWSDGTPRHSQEVEGELLEDANTEHVNDNENEQKKVGGELQEDTEINGEQSNDLDVEQGNNADAIGGDDKISEDISSQEQENTDFREQKENDRYIQKDADHRIQEENDLREQEYNERRKQEENYRREREEYYKNLSDDELHKEYKGIEDNNAAIRDQLKKINKQYDEIWDDKEYYSSEEDWKSRLNEKTNAQNDMTNKIYKNKGETNLIEQEFKRRGR